MKVSALILMSLGAASLVKAAPDANTTPDYMVMTDAVPACPSAAEIKTLLSSASDKAAWPQAQEIGEQEGCIELSKGEHVFPLDTEMWSALIQVRPEGSPYTYWTDMLAVSSAADAPKSHPVVSTIPTPVVPHVRTKVKRISRPARATPSPPKMVPLPAPPLTLDQKVRACIQSPAMADADDVYQRCVAKAQGKVYTAPRL